MVLSSIAIYLQPFTNKFNLDQVNRSNSGWKLNIEDGHFMSDVFGKEKAEIKIFSSGRNC